MQRKTRIYNGKVVEYLTMERGKRPLAHPRCWNRSTLSQDQQATTEVLDMASLNIRKLIDYTYLFEF